jgi:hypothetical protein
VLYKQKPLLINVVCMSFAGYCLLGQRLGSLSAWNQPPIVLKPCVVQNRTDPQSRTETANSLLAATGVARGFAAGAI